MIEADRQALAEAIASGISSKIIAAKEQLSDDLSLEEQQRRQDLEGVSIPLTADGHGHFMADVLLNHSVHASLVIDTGSPVMMISASLAQQLNLDLKGSVQGYVDILNGRYKAAEISLHEVQIGEAKAGDVSTAVLLEEAPGIGDGLLGMSFLSRFHFAIDQKDQKLILKK